LGPQPAPSAVCMYPTGIWVRGSQRFCTETPVFQLNALRCHGEGQRRVFCLVGNRDAILPTPPKQTHQTPASIQIQCACRAQSRGRGFSYGQRDEAESPAAQILVEAAIMASPQSRRAVFGEHAYLRNVANIGAHQRAQDQSDERAALEDDEGRLWIERAAAGKRTMLFKKRSEPVSVRY